MEVKLLYTKAAYDNVNNDNIAMHQIIKDFQKDLLEWMVEKLVGLSKLYKLKEQAQQELQSSIATASLENTSLSVPRPQV